MRLYILGKNNDDKGTQLKTLTAKMLQKIGYIYPTLLDEMQIPVIQDIQQKRSLLKSFRQ